MFDDTDSDDEPVFGRTTSAASASRGAGETAKLAPTGAFAVPAPVRAPVKAAPAEEAAEETAATAARDAPEDAPEDAGPPAPAPITSPSLDSAPDPALVSPDQETAVRAPPPPRLTLSLIHI